MMATVVNFRHCITLKLILNRYVLATMIILALTGGATAECKDAYRQKIKPGFTHTSCKTKQPCNGLIRPPITAAEKALIVNTHNEIRRKFAKGEQPGFPQAANMIALTWNDELAQIAQDHADNCQMKHDAGEERITTEYDSVGQNLAWSSTSGDPKVDYKSSIYNNFYEGEIKALTPGDVDQYTFSMEKGHISQVVWADTKEVGVGAVIYDEGGNKAILETYNYATAANLPGAIMYLKGPPCSKCPNGATCDDALCRLKKDDFSGSPPGAGGGNPGGAGGGAEENKTENGGSGGNEWMYIGGAVGATAVGGGALFYRERQRQAQQESESGTSDQSTAATSSTASSTAQ